MHVLGLSGSTQSSELLTTPTSSKEMKEVRVLNDDKKS